MHFGVNNLLKKSSRHCISIKRKNLGTTHSLIYLGRELKLPKNYWDILRELTKEYYFSRYPDASEDIPYKGYSQEDAERYVEESKRLIKWIESQLKK